MKNSSQTQSLIIGTLIVLLGGFFLLKNFGIITVDLVPYLFNWYSWLLYVGPIMMIKKESRVLGSIFFGIGIIILLGHLGYIPNMKPSQLWPLILVAVGASFVYKSLSNKAPSRPEIDGSSDFIRDNHVFGGGDFNIQSKNFRGGKVFAMFGGGNYNLTQAELSNNGDNVLDVTCVFGGATFVVPADWNVQLAVTSIFGGFADNRKMVPQGDLDNKKTLFITGTAVFGGGEVKSY